jgi:hypothetical protein
MRERKGGKDFLQMGLSIRTSYEGAPGIKPNETKRNETKRNETYEVLGQYSSASVLIS